MFKPRHAYRSPIISRYKGKAKGCPVFNNITDINSSMVEQHDECLECLAKIKNRTDLYRTLADNNKPSNNVIKSLQRLSSSASNNRLKTCLQFLIIKVNEKSISLPHNQQQLNGTNTSEDSQLKAEETTSIKQEANSNIADLTITTTPPTALETTTRFQNNSKRLRLLNQKQKPKYTQQQRQQQQQKQKHNQLASPPQDQVSSTQDQLVPITVTTTNNQDDHDCQSSPLRLVTTQISDDDEPRSEKQFQDSPAMTAKHDVDDNDGVGGDSTSVDVTTKCNGEVDQDVEEEEDDEDEDDHEVDDKIEHISSPAQTHSSPSLNYALKTTATTTTNTSPLYLQNRSHHQNIVSVNCATNSKIASSSSTKSTTPTTTANKRISISDSSSNSVSQKRKTSASAKRRKIHSSSDHDTSSTASWSSTSYASLHSPISTSSTSSISSSSSRSSSSSCSSASSSLSPTPSPSPLSSPDIINELKGPRLKLSEEKIRKIKKRPIIFDDFYTEHSFASTPTTSSGCSPGQHSNTTQNSDCSRLGLSSNNVVVHMFQAPPKFVNNLNLKTCNLPTKVEQPSPANTPPVPTKEMLNCAICGIKDQQPNISKIYGQNSCLICARFFAAFLKRPQHLYCAQDGDCLMTFDSRCQACWIKICLQKFDIEEEHRKIGLKYSPKLLSSPNVSLITIDTSISR